MFLILTNNPMAAEKFAHCGEVRFYPEDNYRQLLIRVRDLVYVGHRLQNHPLYGSLRPHETPYRTVVVSAEASTPDMEECTILSDSLSRLDSFLLPDKNVMSEKLLHDYQLIDCSLVERIFSA